MSLQTVLDLAGAKLSLKEQQLVLRWSGDAHVIKGEPRITLYILAICLKEAGAPCPLLTKYDLLAYGLGQQLPTEEEVTAYRAAEVEPAERTTAEAVSVLEEGTEAMTGLIDCVIVSATSNTAVLSAIRSSLGRGKIDGDRLLLGQTATILQVAKKIKALFDKGVTDRETFGTEMVSTDGDSWADDVEGENRGSGETGMGATDGSCEKWIDRYGKMDYNKLSKGEDDFFLKDWIASKGFSAGSQKKFFAKVPRTVCIEKWADKIYSLLQDEGAHLDESEVDTAGLWAIRKYHGQLTVVGNRENRRVCRKN